MSKDNEQSADDYDRYLKGRFLFVRMAFSVFLDNHVKELSKEREEAIEAGQGVKGMEEMFEDAREQARADVKDVLYFIDRS